MKNEEEKKKIIIIIIIIMIIIIQIKQHIGIDPAWKLICKVIAIKVYHGEINHTTWYIIKNTGPKTGREPPHTDKVSNQQIK